MATIHDLTAVLAHHIGRGRGIRGDDLAKRLGLESRQVRKLISDAIEENGTAICGHPSTGYFIASNADELMATVDFHKHRALHELRKASRLSKIPLPDLIGQLHLKT